MQQKCAPRMRWRVVVVNTGERWQVADTFAGLISRFRHFYLGSVLGLQRDKS